MLINKLDYQIPDTYEISDGLNYFFLFLLFFGIIFAVVVIIYFAKWLTLGPKVKKRWAKITGKNKGDAVVEGVQIKGKEILVDANYEEELKKKIAESHSPQEKLDYQNKLDKHLKQKVKAEEELRKAEEAKLAKIEEKEERARVQKEAKEEAKKYKEEAKKAKEEGK